MPILGVNHLNIRTPDFISTIEFLRNALGMVVSTVPGFDTTEKAAWAYDDAGVPILHLARADVAYSPSEVLPAESPRGSGAIHHVAISCTDFEAMKARLVAFGASFREGTPEPGVRQIFVRDPTDIRIELNFREK